MSIDPAHLRGRSQSRKMAPVALLLVLVEGLGRWRIFEMIVFRYFLFSLLLAGEAFYGDEITVW